MSYHRGRSTFTDQPAMRNVTSLMSVTQAIDAMTTVREAQRRERDQDRRRDVPVPVHASGASTPVLERTMTAQAIAASLNAEMVVDTAAPAAPTTTVVRMSAHRAATSFF